MNQKKHKKLIEVKADKSRSKANAKTETQLQPSEPTPKVGIDAKDAA